MKLTPVIDILRFVSIDGTTIVHITQSRSNLGTYSDPPVVEDIREVWGTCLDDTPDSFREIGQLQDVLRTIAPRQMVTAAATASPRRFAEMIAFAHDLGLVFYVASRAMWLVADHIADAQGFCEIEVQE